MKIYSYYILTSTCMAGNIPRPTGQGSIEYWYLLARWASANLLKFSIVIIFLPAKKPKEGRGDFVNSRCKPYAWGEILQISYFSKVL